MSDEMAQELKYRLFYPVKIVNYLLIFLSICGVGCVFLGFIKMIISYRKTLTVRLTLHTNAI